MDESTPPPVELPRSKVEENAPTAADTARLYFLLAVGLAVLMPLGILATWFFVPADMFVMVMSMQIAWVVLALAGTGFMWKRARGDLTNYANQTRIIWTLECRDTAHSWDIAGLGPCEGWRRMAVTCVRLPKRQGKWLALPALKVTVDNEDRPLASGTIAPNDKRASIACVDKAGRPVRIMLSHQRAEDASDEFRWLVEIAVQGDPNLPETLVATAVAAGNGAGRG